MHCVKIVRAWSFSGPHFPAFGLNADQKNAEYGHFSRSDELRHSIFAKYKSGFLKMNFTSTDLFLEDLLS